MRVAEQPGAQAVKKASAPVDEREVRQEGGQAGMNANASACRRARRQARMQVGGRTCKNAHAARPGTELCAL